MAESNQVVPRAYGEDGIRCQLVTSIRFGEAPGRFIVGRCSTGELAKAALAARNFWPALGSALYAALFSASFELDGLSLTYGFELTSRRRCARMAECLSVQSARCRELSGRVRLTKTVRASERDLSEMCGHALAALTALKRRIDPKLLLRSEFVARVLSQLH